MFTVMGTQEPEGQCRQLMPSEANNAVHSTWDVLVQTVLVENGRYSADASRASGDDGNAVAQQVAGKCIQFSFG